MPNIEVPPDEDEGPEEGTPSARTPTPTPDAAMSKPQSPASKSSTPAPKATAPKAPTPAPEDEDELPLHDPELAARAARLWSLEELRKLREQTTSQAKGQVTKAYNKLYATLKNEGSSAEGTEFDQNCFVDVLVLAGMEHIDAQKVQIDATRLEQIKESSLTAVIAQICLGPFVDWVAYETAPKGPKDPTKSNNYKNSSKGAQEAIAKDYDAELKKYEKLLAAWDKRAPVPAGFEPSSEQLAAAEAEEGKEGKEGREGREGRESLGW